MRWTRPTLALSGAAAVLAVAGCGLGGDRAAVPQTATGSLEQLAAEVRCAPDMQTDEDEIRQALCRNPDGRFVLATFATDRGGSGSGSTGPRTTAVTTWSAASGSPWGGDTPVVRSLQTTLGGDIEEGADHSGHEGGGGDAHSAH
ncbi:lipoprotein [Streptomyces cinereospinus]